MINNSNSEYEFGASKHTWNDWAPLANAISDFDAERGYLPEDKVTQFKDYEEYWKAGVMEHMRHILTRELNAMRSGDVLACRNLELGNPRCVVLPYSVRLSSDKEVNLQEIGEQEFNQRFADYVLKGMKYSVVRRLDELANQVNISIRGAVFENGIRDWELYHSAAKEAGHLIYGERGTFLDRCNVPPAD